MIDLDKMAEEHKKLFPNATLESQVWKLEEEITEWSHTKNYEDGLREIADIVIVCGGLLRWCPALARNISYHFVDEPRCEVYGGREAIEKEVNRKWQINLKRKWEWNGKTYHHVD